MESLSASLEDYLEAISHISAIKKVARPKDIADRLKVNNSSVTGALKTLTDKGLINYAPHDVITLTPSGEQAAEDVIRRHETLRDFFQEVLSVNPEEAEDSACKMEHAISPGIIERFLRFSEFMTLCPRGGARWAEGFKSYCEKGCKQAECENCITLCLEDLKKKFSPGKSSSSHTVTLQSMGPGCKCRIVKIRARGDIHRRMVEMGLSTGSLVKVERTAPLGDPMSIKVKGYHLSLRGTEAQYIEVEPL